MLRLMGKIEEREQNILYILYYINTTKASYNACPYKPQPIQWHMIKGKKTDANGLQTCSIYIFRAGKEREENPAFTCKTT